MPRGATKAGVDDLFGILSLMFWALIMVVTVKYLTFVMRADHHGEGGIFALLAIVPERFRTHAARSGKVTGMALLAVIGASLVVRRWRDHAGDFRLQCRRGLAVASPRLSPLVLPLTCGILVGAVLDPAARNRGRRQAVRSGDGGLVRDAGGARHLSLIQKPEILGALSPHHGAAFFLSPRNPRHADPRLGRPGRDGRRGPVRGHGPFRGPADSPDLDILRPAALVLGYLGQGALILRHPEAVEQPVLRAWCRRACPLTCWSCSRAPPP